MSLREDFWQAKEINEHRITYVVWSCLELADVIREIEGGKKIGDIVRRRVACAHCGSTWVELVGLIVTRKAETESVCLRIGMESEYCQTCRFRPLECQECGSKDVYETTFAKGVSEEAPLGFKSIRTVARNSNAKTS